MPEAVPPMVSQSFSSLIPGVLVVIVSLLMSGLARNIAGSYPELICQIMQIPLAGLTSSLGAITILAD